MYQHSTDILAIDFVLLPADQEVEDIVFLNKNLSQPANHQIILSGTGNQPHLSLLMGGLPVAGISEAEEKLQAVARSFESFYLKINKTVLRNDCVSLDIEKNQKLQLLHQTLIEEFYDLKKTDITGEMFVVDSVISDGSIKYINSYWQQSIREDFWPHITLGYGKLAENARIPEGIGFDKIGLYHLGNHCTCNKNIFTIALAAG